MTEQEKKADPFAIANAVPIPEGFNDVGQISAIDYEELTDGKVAKYLGSRSVTDKKTNKSYTLHEFEEDESMGWALWGSGALDARMKSVPVGATVWIRYAGKIPHPTAGTNADGSPKKTLHTFQVAMKGGRKVGNPAPTAAPAAIAAPPADDDLPF